MTLQTIAKPFIQVFALTLVLIQPVFAADVTVVGTIEQRIKQSSPGYSAANEKIIRLLRIELSDEAKKRLQIAAQYALAHTHQFAPTSSNSENLGLPKKVNLGMHKVPVLDQGMHGTCVTFAVTGAIDAIIGKGDYVSQLCNLQLGNYLEQHGYGWSGWDGSNDYHVIDQIVEFGIVNKKKQHASGCGGFKHYPTYYWKTPKSSITPEKYHPMSEMIFGKVVNWSNVYDYRDPVKTLDNVKQALNAKNRVVFGIMLPRPDLGCAGAVGKYKTWIFKDTWVLTPDILKDVGKVKSGHEMIIIGYDDNAVAVDNKGKKHKGLLLLRNSWGRLVGDYGTFYMSYDYFKLLADSVKQLSPT